MMKNRLDKMSLPKEPTYDELLKFCQKCDWLEPVDWEILESFDELSDGLGYLFAARIALDCLKDKSGEATNQMDRSIKQLEVELYDAGLIEKSEDINELSDNNGIN